MISKSSIADLNCEQRHRHRLYRRQTIPLATLTGWGSSCGVAGGYCRVGCRCCFVAPWRDSGIKRKRIETCCLSLLHVLKMSALIIRWTATCTCRHVHVHVYEMTITKHAVADARVSVRRSERKWRWTQHIRNNRSLTNQGVHNIYYMLACWHLA